MFINKLELKNFKRFTDLTIDLTSAQDENPPKLVLLIGANGSGKSCIFDAFEFTNNIVPNKELLLPSKDTQTGKHKSRSADLRSIDNDRIIYCSKNKNLRNKFGIELEFTSHDYFQFNYKGVLWDEQNGLFDENSGLWDDIDYSQSNLNTNLKSGNYFYGRSAFRYLPRLSKETIGQVKQETISQNLDRPKTYIDLDDKRFENDFDFLVTQTVYEIFNSQIPAQEKLDKINNLLSKVNSSLERIFGNNQKTSLKFKEFKTPSGGESAKLLFQKGDSIFHYDLLSAGEKEVVNIIFDLYVREPYFQDAIYFFDELDLHLNTSLQFDLLKEITENWIPENSQVWVASHSLGFIDYARQYEKGVIIDFDSLDFDEEQVLKPESKGLKNYEIAVPANLIQDLFRGKQIFICENKNDQIFNSLLLAEKLFVGVHDKNSILIEIKKNTNYFALRDRDYLTDEEIQKTREKYKNLFILDYYCLENYLYYPENLLELNLKDFNIKDYEQEIINQKNLKKEKIKINHLKDDRKSDLLLKEIQPDTDYYQFIGESLDSDDFSKLYTFFNMKDFNRKYLEKYQITEEMLSKTNWFKSKISEVLQ
jgi:AAA ATPase domain